MSSLPVEHVEEYQKLRPENPVDLFELTLLESAGVLSFWNGPTRTWQSTTYQGLANTLTEEGQTSDDESKRPQHVIHNPSNIFAPYILADQVEGAFMTRKRVLKTHFEGDVNIYTQRIWRVAAVRSLGDQVVTLELRDPSDGPNFLLPARVYAPPEFPAVNLR